MKIYQMPLNQQQAMFQAIASQDPYFGAKITAGAIIGFVIGVMVGMWL